MTETELIHVCDVGSDNILWDSVTSLDTESSVGIGIGEGRGFNKCRCGREDISGGAAGGVVGKMCGDRAHRGWVGWVKSRFE